MIHQKNPLFQMFLSFLSYPLCYLSLFLWMAFILFTIELFVPHHFVKKKHFNMIIKTMNILLCLNLNVFQPVTFSRDIPRIPGSPHPPLESSKCFQPFVVAGHEWKAAHCMKKVTQKHSFNLCGQIRSSFQCQIYLVHSRLFLKISFKFYKVAETRNLKSGRLTLWLITCRVEKDF